MDHKFAKITKTPMAWIGTQADGTPDLVVDPFQEVEEVVGCMVCDMGIDEASQSNCLGVPLEKLLEEE